MKKNKENDVTLDAFSGVEADAKRLLKNPAAKGAATAVLNFIHEQREKQ